MMSIDEQVLYVNLSSGKGSEEGDIFLLSICLSGPWLTVPGPENTCKVYIPRY
jgi:hypothetical protein